MIIHDARKESYEEGKLNSKGIFLITLFIEIPDVLLIGMVYSIF